MDISEFGRLIRERRVFLLLNQHDLSELSEVNTRTIHAIEQGTGNPSLDTLQKIATVLGLEIILKVKQIN